MTVAVVAGVLLVVSATLAAAVTLMRRRRRARPAYQGRGRILVPFSGALDPRVLEAAIRVARAEQAVLVAAYLLIVPLQYAEDSARKDQVALALPLLEAVELSALRAGVPVDARIEKGRSLTHALRRLWEVESFDRIVAPASGFTARDLAWILTNAPAETIVLRTGSAAAAA
jgi:hypothetical protein